MKTSASGETVYLQVGVWKDEDGTIHLTAKEPEDFIVAVNEDEGQANGHPTLYKHLSKLLDDAGKG